MAKVDPAQPVWERIIDSGSSLMPPEAAKYFLSLSISAKDRSRYKLLASRDRQTLDVNELAELASLVQANTSLMLLQAKARLVLKPRRHTA